MSIIAEPISRQDSLTDSEVEIVDPEDCTENGKKVEAKQLLKDDNEKEKKSGNNTEEEEVDGTEDENETEEESDEEEEITEADRWYGYDSRKRALNNLVYYSILMFIFPLVTMYLTYQYIFIDIYHYDTDTAAMYSGLIAAGLVYVIIISFIWEAYKEEQEAEVRKKAMKSD
uniref:Vacuolar ATPase assembly integral membrane protein VMA21 homolog n=1 Tax=Parastrongyloides trichosuri TaxID=131310 RepID=A0A0N4Z2D9_PARTI